MSFFVSDLMLCLMFCSSYKNLILSGRHYMEMTVNKALRCCSSDLLLYKRKTESWIASCHMKISDNSTICIPKLLDHPYFATNSSFRADTSYFKTFLIDYPSGIVIHLIQAQKITNQIKFFCMEIIIFLATLFQGLNNRTK